MPVYVILPYSDWDLNAGRKIKKSVTITIDLRFMARIHREGIAREYNCNCALPPRTVRWTARAAPLQMALAPICAPACHYDPPSPLNRLDTVVAAAGLTLPRRDLIVSRAGPFCTRSSPTYKRRPLRRS